MKSAFFLRLSGAKLKAIRTVPIVDNLRLRGADKGGNRPAQIRQEKPPLARSKPGYSLPWDLWEKPPLAQSNPILP